MQGEKLNIWLPSGYSERIERLMDTLAAQGVDLRNEKHPAILSISKLLRYLIEQEEQRQNQTRP